MDSDAFVHQDMDVVISSPNIFSVLSDSDNFRMFVIAKDGLKISVSTLDALRISPKKYYKALKQLKDAGLIKKNRQGSYLHTTFGSIVYQRNIVEMAQYTKHLEKMQMIDTIREAKKFPETAIASFIEELKSTVVGFSSSAPPTPSSALSSIYDSINSSGGANLFPTIDIILSFDKVMQILVERIDCCKSEILIATRICPEIVINKILDKSKLGVKVKVIADIDLLKEYFKIQQKFVDNLNENNPIQERKCVIANPWYPDNSINRRIADIPFGVIILDKHEVGIELVNCNNPKEFYGGVFIKDEKVSIAISDFYQKIWEKASENTDIIKEQKVE